MKGSNFAANCCAGLCRAAALLALFSAAAFLPKVANADCVAIGTNCIKFENGPPPTQTLPGMTVTAPYLGVGYMQLWETHGSFLNDNLSNRGGGSYAFNNKTASTDKNKNKADCQNTASDPVVVSDGAKVLSIPLFQMSGEMSLKYVLYYHSVTSSSFWAFNPWASSISYVLDLYCGFTNPNIQCSQVTLYRPDGSSVSFSGNHASYGNFPEIGGGGLATLVHNSNGTWTLHDEDSNILTFDTNGYFTSIKDVSGVGWTISSTTVMANTASLDGTIVSPCRETAGVGTLTTCPTPPPPPTTTTTTTVTHTDGQSFTIVEVVKNAGTSFTSGSVTVTDPAGNKYSYVLGFYEVPNSGGLGAEDVTSLTFPGSPATTMTFSYTGANQLLSGVAYDGTAYWSTGYDSSNRVSSDGAADGTERTSIVYATSSGGMVATITNPLGLTTKNTYTTDAQGNYLLASVSNSAVQGCGATINSMAWDANDNLTKTVDNDGITHTYSYAANGQLQTETEASGTTVARTTNYTWDPNAQLNRPLSVTIPGESKTSYTYNAQNRLASVTRTNLTSVGTLNQSLTTTYAYALYANGMVHTMTVTAPSPAGSDHTTYTYDTLGNLTSVVDGLGHVTSYTGYNALGEPGHITGPNGDVTDYTWDARGRMASKTTHLNGVAAAWTHTYDDYGLPASITAPDGEITTWARDAEMRVKTITHNDKDGTSTETFAYDANGDVTSDVIARGTDVGKSIGYVYNALGKIYQVKGSHGQVLTYGYDGNGNVLSVTDALGHVTTYAYDGLNRLEGSMDAAGGVTSYTYDVGGHVTHVIDPRGLITGYAWDGLGQLWQQQSPDTGTTNYGYDTYGRLSSFYRADGIVHSYSYDVLNRVTGETAGGVTRTFAYDTCTHGIGRRCTATHVNDDTVSYSYTPEGHIASRSFTFVSGVSYALGYTYDNMGQLASVTYPDGNQAFYDYTRGAVADVRLQIGSASSYAATSVVYRPMDLAMSGWTSSNSRTNAIIYDGDLRPISLTSVVSLALSYDLDNHITGITNRYFPSLSQSLTYDAMGRIATIASGVDNESFIYDADGNRIQHVSSGFTENSSYSVTSNHLTQAAATVYGYDANGDVTTINGHVLYGYSAMGRLVSGNGGIYTIGAEDQRLRKTVAPDQTYFAPDRSGVLLAENLSGTWQDYIYLGEQLIAVAKAGQVYSVHSDQTGRPLVLLNSAKEGVWVAEGLPFSSPITANTFGAFNLGYPGQYHDDETNIWYNGYRGYMPWLGRYSQSDPIGLAGGINTYAYVGNNPISNVDPLGLCDKPKCTAAQARAAAVAGKLAQYAEAAAGVAFVADASAAANAARGDEGDVPYDAMVGEIAGGLSWRMAGVSAALDTYASSPHSILGAAQYFGGFLTDQAASLAAKLDVLRALPGANELGNVAGDTAGQAADSALPSPPNPCASQ